MKLTIKILIAEAVVAGAVMLATMVNASLSQKSQACEVVTIDPDCELGIDNMAALFAGNMTELEASAISRVQITISGRHLSSRNDALDQVAVMMSDTLTAPQLGASRCRYRSSYDSDSATLVVDVEADDDNTSGQLLVMLPGRWLEKLDVHSNSAASLTVDGVETLIMELDTSAKTVMQRCSVDFMTLNMDVVDNYRVGSMPDLQLNECRIMSMAMVSPADISGAWIGDLLIDGDSDTQMKLTVVAGRYIKVGGGSSRIGFENIGTLTRVDNQITASYEY